LTARGVAHLSRLGAPMTYLLLAILQEIRGKY
jgi:hypothetical protein